jgi:hypothetical protein
MGFSEDLNFDVFLTEVEVPGERESWRDERDQKVTRLAATLVRVFSVYNRRSDKGWQ